MFNEGERCYFTKKRKEERHSDEHSDTQKRARS